MDFLIHPVVVHFAVATPVMVLLVAVMYFFRTRTDWFVLKLLSVCTVVSIIAARITGEEDHEIVHEGFPNVPHSILEQHEFAANASLVGSIVLLLVVWAAPRKFRLPGIVLSSAVLTALVALTGLYGGQLVYEHGAQVRVQDTSLELMSEGGGHDGHDAHGSEGSHGSHGSSDSHDSHDSHESHKSHKSGAAHKTHDSESKTAIDVQKNIEKDSTPPKQKPQKQEASEAESSGAQHHNHGQHKHHDHP